MQPSSVHSVTRNGGQSPTNVMVFGCAGTGKSTLLNRLANDRLFESDICFDAAMTTQTKSEIRGDVIYIDTPALGSGDGFEERAAMITKELRSPHPFRLLFLVRLYHGRVVDEDIAEMVTVLTSIGDPSNVTFSVVVNSVSKCEMRQLQSDPIAMQRVVKAINSDVFKTDSVVLLEEDDELSEARNKLIPLPSGVRDTIFAMDAMHIRAPYPQPIDADAAMELRQSIALRLQGVESQLRQESVPTLQTEHTGLMAQTDESNNEAASSSGQIIGWFNWIIRVLTRCFTHPAN